MFDYSETDKMNASYLNLPLSQMSEYNKLMSSNISDWPEDLTKYVFSGKIYSGDGIAVAVAEWLKLKNET